VRALASLLRREIALAWGGGGGPLFACAFFLGVAMLLPLGAGADPARLRAVAPGAAFAALALASILSLERMFERDFEDGSLDLLSLGTAPLEAVAGVKALAQWLAAGLPLAVLAPVVAVMLGSPLDLMPMVFVTALLAGLAFAFTGGVGAAVTLGARRGGVLTAMVVLPLFTPPVIFGAGAVTALAQGLDWRSGLVFLLAYTLACAALAPFAMAAAIKTALT
jgi:heme exporter protein B